MAFQLSVRLNSII